MRAWKQNREIVGSDPEQLGTAVCVLAHVSQENAEPTEEMQFFWTLHRGVTKDDFCLLNCRVQAGIAVKARLGTAFLLKKAQQ